MCFCPSHLLSIPPALWTPHPAIHSKYGKSKRGPHGKNKGLRGIKLSKYICEKCPASSDLTTLDEIASKTTSPRKARAVCISELAEAFQHSVSLSRKQSAVFTLWGDAIYKCHSWSCHQKKILLPVKSEILQHSNKLMCDDHSKFDRIQSLLLSLLKLHNDQRMTLTSIWHCA